jgi:hypothetical protein
MKNTKERLAVCKKSLYDVKSWKYLNIGFCKLRAMKIAKAGISEDRVRKLNFDGICSIQTFIRN